MSTLSDLLAEHTTLSDSAAAHLQRLVAEWQLLADLSFADLLLSVRTEAGAVVTVAPVLILFLALQRYYIRGMLAGSVKG